MSFSSTARLTDVRRSQRRTRAQKSILSAGRVEINFSSFKDTLFNIFLYPSCDSMSQNLKGLLVEIYPVGPDGARQEFGLQLARLQGRKETTSEERGGGNEWHGAHFLPHLRRPYHNASNQLFNLPICNL